MNKIKDKVLAPIRWVHRNAKMKDLKDITHENDMIMDVRDRPRFRSWVMLAIQHVIAMFGATVLIPLLINTSPEIKAMGGGDVIGTDVALFSSGVGTLLYIAITRARVPIYLGSSIAYVGAVTSLYPIYGTATFFGFLGVGVVYAIVSFLIYFFGTGWLKKMLPPVVIGPMIMVIGLSLAGVVIGWLGLKDLNHINWWGLLIAFITVATAISMSLLMRGRLKLIPILGALVVGLAVSLLVSTWQDGIVDYHKDDWAALDTYIGVPDFSHTLITGQGSVGTKWSIVPFFVMMPIALATIAEHIGDHTVLGRITGKDYIGGRPGLHKTLLGDGVATMFGGLVSGPANTSYGENTTTVGLSKVGSVWVTGLAAVFAIIMSFFQLVPSVLRLMPNFVLGGVGIVLFGFIASNGFKVIVQEKVDVTDTRNIFIMSIMLIIGLGGAVLGGTLNNTEIKFSGTSLAMICGMLANAIIPKDRGIDMNKMPKISNKDKGKEIKHKR